MRALAALHDIVRAPSPPELPRATALYYNPPQGTERIHVGEPFSKRRHTDTDPQTSKKESGIAFTPAAMPRTLFSMSMPTTVGVDRTKTLNGTSMPTTVGVDDQLNRSCGWPGYEAACPTTSG